MKTQTLKALIGAAEEQLVRRVPGGAIHSAWMAIISDARKDLERRLNPLTASDPVTISMDDLEALRWIRDDYTAPFEPRIVFHNPTNPALAVYFHEDGRQPEIIIGFEDDMSADGVKTIDDLIAFAHLLTGQPSEQPGIDDQGTSS